MSASPLVAYACSLHASTDFREKLYKIKGIRHSRSSFVLRTLKKADLPLFVG